MRDSNIKRDNYNTESEIISIDEYPVFKDFEYDLMDDKDYKKYIIDIKRFVRNSIEYKRLREYLKNYVDMDKCAIYENVTNAQTGRIKIHIHHQPFTIEDIIRIVVRKRMSKSETLNIPDVAYEVLYLHYNGFVGLIPVSETVHELIHNKYIFISLDIVYGDWKKFYNMYNEYLDDYEELIDENIEKSKECRALGVAGIDVLNKKYIYLNTSKLYNLPEDKEIIKTMKDRVKEIKDSPKIYENKKIKPLHYINESKNSIF